MFITCQQLILNLRILNLCHEDEFVYSYNKKVNKAPNLYKIYRFRIGYLMNKIMVHKIKINKKSLKLVVRSHELFPKPKKYIFLYFPAIINQVDGINTSPNLSNYRNSQRKNQENIWRAFQSLFGAGLHSNGKSENGDKPTIYIITPTWPRPVQIAELTRLGYVLKVSIFILFLQVGFYIPIIFSDSHFNCSNEFYPVTSNLFHKIFLTSHCSN